MTISIPLITAITILIIIIILINISYYIITIMI